MPNSRSLGTSVAPDSSGREDLFDGHVEIEGRFAAGRVSAPVSSNTSAATQRIIDQRPVLDHHALGLAGRAGGVDDVGQMPRRQTRARRIQGWRRTVPPRAPASALSIRRGTAGAQSGKARLAIPL